MPSLWRVERPHSFWDAAGCHIALLLVTGGILLASWILRPDMIPFRTCMFVRWTGHPCITCGYTRAFLALGKGDWPLVLHDCPVAIPLYVLVSFVFAWNAAAMAFGVILSPGPLLKARASKWGGILVLTALVVANWIYRWAMGFR